MQKNNHKLILFYTDWLFLQSKSKLSKTHKISTISKTSYTSKIIKISKTTKTCQTNSFVIDFLQKGPFWSILKSEKKVIFYVPCLPLQAFQIGVKYLSKLLWKWTCNIIWNISCRTPSWNSYYVWHSVTPLKCLHVVILSIIVDLLNEKFVPFDKTGVKLVMRKLLNVIRDLVITLNDCFILYSERCFSTNLIFFFFKF